ncbi:MAG: lipid-A-disaccharide synthase [Thermoguttaceae bacterium]|nr:lipid-A-disaccharide synthase [Thermoguttaceae bacterium]
MARPFFFISAGEPSGDQHAAGLIRELKKRFPDAEFRGFGGPEMKEAGCRIEYDLTALSVMWFLQAVMNIPLFARLLKKAREAFRRDRPDILILVDYPGFNYRLAKDAKAAGIPVCFFVPPQIWAWAQGRIKKTRRDVDFIISPLPFEQKWFRERGVETVAVPHPFFDEMNAEPLDRGFIASIGGETGAVPEGASAPRPIPAEPILTLLPGSRRSEIAANLPEMARAALLVQKDVPGLRPTVAAYRSAQVPLIREILQRENAPFPVYAGRTRELIASGVCALSVSGSVSIELLALAKPAVIYYRVGRFALWFSRFFRRVKYISLVNLLAADARGESIFCEGRRAPAELSPRDREASLFPELLTGRDRSADAARCLTVWLTDPDALARRRAELARLRAQVASDGGRTSFELAADAVSARLGERFG